MGRYAVQYCKAAFGYGGIVISGGICSGCLAVDVSLGMKILGLCLTDDAKVLQQKHELQHFFLRLGLAGRRSGYAGN